MQGSDRDADIENRLWTQLGKEKVGQWERSIETYALPYVKWIARRDLQELKPGDLRHAEGWEVGGRFKTGGVMCRPRADSC